MNKTLTASERATIMDACQSISRSADELKAGCSDGNEWDNPEVKAEYDAELRLLERLTALLSDHPGEPETRAAARSESLIKTLSDIIHDQTVTMQSAVIEWQHGNGAEAGLSWIVNTLEGPGHLPDFDAPHGKHAQFWFNANQANPLPACFCGNPSSSLWMGQGFCCDEHYREARSKHDTARAGASQ